MNSLVAALSKLQQYVVKNPDAGGDVYSQVELLAILSMMKHSVESISDADCENMDDKGDHGCDDIEWPTE